LWQFPIKKSKNYPYTNYIQETFPPKSTLFLATAHCAQNHHPQVLQKERTNKTENCVFASFADYQKLCLAKVLCLFAKKKGYFCLYD
jgi:hypothetical protein